MRQRADETNFIRALPFRQIATLSLHSAIRATAGIAGQSTGCSNRNIEYTKEPQMKYPVRTLACAFALTFGAAAHAAPKLTPEQCSDYPFVHTKGPVTRAQLMNELSELESVGYDPSAGDESGYPDDIDDAQQKLMQKYQTDCVGAGGSIASNGN
ncbi:hypothetical protein C7S16_3275 [Burkholderia thailandensis]|uniref:DUF4148 domain-containing protein n=1 Tax=Burkholderia thailandensis TaxID=57975 RepID=A0AAW9D693_BURTH|nr:DUF4148 domain-containing protein [Burkholderia thailandensis]MDW9238209.1 hypothetical protein [Burkholderia thailandensis]MDW9257540.1 hypothetical protein [Burkholderia thailandensis]QRA10888.1 DUF4148 domain-containing protein [Burkholderia thailandensis]